MILITSAAYVTPGLVAEFGNLPPCMLPVQNRRLYYHQVQLLRQLGEEIFLSLPSSYDLSTSDMKQLGELAVHVIKVPEMSLGASVVYVLNVLGRFNEPVRILHGDTLLDSVPDAIDTCSVSRAEDDYKWASVNANRELVYAGYFSFSLQAVLIRCITEHNYDFMAGVAAYDKERNMQFCTVSSWLDFGIINSYYRSKSKMTTQRVFNNLQIDKYSVKKYSKDSNKILAEANWFLSLPSPLKHFVPALWDHGMKDESGFYEIEYFYLSSLADLFVFGNNPFFVWKGILNSCSDFINQTSKYSPDNIEEIARQSVSLYGQKTRQRLSEYAEKSGLSLQHTWTINGIATPSLADITAEISTELDNPSPQFMRIMHGDFCFSNILYDFKSLSIKVLDPRGRDLEGKYSIYGDIRYDVAKLAHSVIGLYDYIIGGFFECKYDKENYSMELHFPKRKDIGELQEYFDTLKFGGYSVRELSVYPILIHLFLSMLPLHCDNPARQEAMLANALRLYTDYKDKNAK